MPQMSFLSLSHPKATLFTVFKWFGRNRQNSLMLVPLGLSLPVVVLQLYVVCGFQNLPILQPRYLWGRFPLGQAGKDGRGPHRPRNGLRMLHKFCRGCKEKEQVVKAGSILL